jgi:hypothetical protein
MRAFLDNVRQSLADRPRPVVIVYTWPGAGLHRRRQRFTRSNESDRNFVLQRLPRQFQVLGPLAQLLGGLFFVGAQFGEEACVHLVDRLIGVLALVATDQEARGAVGRQSPGW